MFQSMLLKTWWTFEPGDESLFSTAYHAFNLCEGLAWCGLAILVLLRYAMNRRSAIEIGYAAAFACFGATDFREAYALQTWLIAAKGLNLAVLLALRSIVLRRFYPQCKLY